MKTLEAANAAANFANILDAVQSLHESFAIMRKGVPCANLVPVVAAESNSHELAGDLHDVKLSAEDRRSFAADLRRGRKRLKPPKDPWG